MTWGMAELVREALRKLQTQDPALNAVYAHRQFRSLEDFRPFLLAEHPR
jgi:hypothetical protein